MRLLKLLPPIAAVLLSLATGLAAGAEHELEPAQADASERFATDEILRRNMQQIRNAVGALSAAADGRPDPAQTVALSEDIAASVREIIKHCQLPPDADTALHRIIHPLMVGAHALQAEPSDVAPLASMREALGAYGRHFDDSTYAVPAD